MPTNQLLGPSAVARVLNVSTTRVRVLADTGRLPVAATTEVGMRLFRAEDVAQFVAARAELPRRSGRPDRSDQPTAA